MPDFSAPKWRLKTRKWTIKRLDCFFYARHGSKNDARHFIGLSLIWIILCHVWHSFWHHVGRQKAVKLYNWQFTRNHLCNTGKQSFNYVCALVLFSMNIIYGAQMLKLGIWLKLYCFLTPEIGSKNDAGHGIELFRARLTRVISLPGSMSVVKKLPNCISVINCPISAFSLHMCQMFRVPNNTKSIN